MFQMQWQLPNFADYDLSSLRTAMFGGQQVTRPFLQQLCAMLPYVATGLGMTEMAGFVTYTGLTRDIDYIINGVGVPMPITPLSIRRPMKPDGTAGDELPAGETGEICFAGPQVFIGYVGNSEAYRQTVSSDGFCYTGDMGFVNDRGLVLAGRSKLVIKPKGFQVHPAQVEQHFAESEYGSGRLRGRRATARATGRSDRFICRSTRGPKRVACPLGSPCPGYCVLYATNSLCTA